MRIGAFSDVHEDAESLAVILQQMERLGVDQIACLGDIVGYDVFLYRHIADRDANACLDMIRANCKWALAGNHDLYALRKIPTVNGVFKYPEDWYLLDFQERKRLAGDQVWLYEHRELSPLLDGRNRDYLESLPQHTLIEPETGCKIMLSHSIHPDWSGSLTWRPSDSWDYRSHLACLQESGCRLGLSGHVHPPGMQLVTANNLSSPVYAAAGFPKEPFHCVIPSVVRNSNRNGFLILDTLKRYVEAVPLAPKKSLLGWRRGFKAGT